MARKSLIVVLAVAISLCFIGQGFCQSGKKTSSTTTTEKQFTALPDKDGNNTTRFYGKDGSSTGRAEGSGKTTRFYGKDGSSSGRADR